MNENDKDSDRPSEPPEPDRIADSIRKHQKPFADPLASISTLDRALAPSRTLAQVASLPSPIKEMENFHKEIMGPGMDGAHAYESANAIIGPTLDAAKVARSISSEISDVVGPSAKQAMGIGKTLERVMGPMSARRAMGLAPIEQRRRIMSGLTDQFALREISSNVLDALPTANFVTPSFLDVHSRYEQGRLWPTPDDVAKVVQAEPTGPGAEFEEPTEEQKQITIVAVTEEMTMIRDRTRTMTSIELRSLAESPAEEVRGELGVTLLPDASIAKALTQLATVAQDRELNGPRDRRDRFRTRLLIGSLVIGAAGVLVGILGLMITYQALRTQAPVVAKPPPAPVVLEEPPELQLDMPDALPR